VITLQKFKRLVEKSGNKLAYNNKNINRIAYIYCVGSRQYEGENQYCSRYCCTAAIYSSIIVKEKFPEIHNIHLTRGVRTYGKQEILYNQSNEQRDIYLQFNDVPPEIAENNGVITLKVNDELTLGKNIEMDVDLVVLVTGMVPKENNNLENILKIPIGRDKFYNEIHPKLRPVETMIDGVLISGTCQAPMNISETVKSSLSAVAKMNSLISHGVIKLEPILAKIDKSSCEWCDECTKICPFSAIIKTDYNGKAVAEVNEANCKGCGMCLPVCPTHAIQLSGYTNIEMESMITALIS
jgi:heterodisulfide reductase subunit A